MTLKFIFNLSTFYEHNLTLKLFIYKEFSNIYIINLLVYNYSYYHLNALKIFFFKKGLK